VSSIVLVEFRTGLLNIRRELLESLGRPVVSAQGVGAAKRLDLSREVPALIVIGHRATRQARQDLITHFRDRGREGADCYSVGQERCSFR
jgi:hypothetical protein